MRAFESEGFIFTCSAYNGRGKRGEEGGKAPPRRRLRNVSLALTFRLSSRIKSLFKEKEKKTLRGEEGEDAGTEKKMFQATENFQVCLLGV